MAILALTPFGSGVNDSEKYNVKLDFIEEGLTHRCLGVEIQNLQDSSDDLDLGTILNEANFPVGEMKNGKFYQEKMVSYYVDVPIYVDENYDCSYYDNITKELVGKTCQRKTQTGSYEEERQRLDWVEQKLLQNNVNSVEVKQKWENVQIQKFGQEKDNLNFKYCFDVPIVRNGNGWGNAGTVYVEVNGDLFVDKTHSSWWNDSYDYRMNITEVAISPSSRKDLIIFPVNGTDGSDIDDNGVKEWIYGNSPEYLYFNDENDPRIANDTSEFYLIQTSPEIRHSGTAPSDLVLYFPFDNEISNTAIDFSGEGNNATTVTATQGFDGYVGNAYDFSAGEYVRVPDDDSLTPSSEITVMAWIYTNAHQGKIVDKYAPGDRSWTIHIDRTNHDLMWTVSSTGDPFTGKEVSSGEAMDLNTWYHVAVNFEADHVEIFVNGTEVKDDTDSAIADSIYNNNEYLRISTADNFLGTIDDVRVYSKRLVAAEIKEIYDATKDAHLGTKEEQNTAPTVTTPTLTPTTAYTTDNLNCTFTITDPEEEQTLHANYTWYRNGTAYLEGQEVVTNGTPHTITLDSSNTKKNQFWNCSILPYDGIDYGIENFSTAVTILNSPPTNPTIINLEPAGEVYTDTIVNCTASGSTDDDNDNITYYYKFNDTNNAILQNWDTTNTFDCSTAGCDKGDTLFCHTKAYDLEDFSPGFITDSETVLNSAPTFAPISDFSKGEDFGSFEMDLSNNVSDIDEDNLTIQYILNSTNYITLTLDNDTKVANFYSVQDAHGITEVTFIVYDDEMANSSTTFLLTVNPINDPPEIASFNSTGLNKTWYNYTNQADVTFEENDTVRFAVEVSDVDSTEHWYSWFVDGAIKAAWELAKFWYDWPITFFDAGVHNVTSYVKDSGNEITSQYWNVNVLNVVNRFWTVDFITPPTPNDSEVLDSTFVNVSVRIKPTVTEVSELVSFFHDTGEDFNGTNNFTEFNSSDNSVQLSYPNLAGTFEGIIYNAGKETIWDNLSWDGFVPTNGELSPEEDMVSLWHMNYNWNDSSGMENDGTPQNGATFTPDSKYGSHAGSLDGTNDYVSVSDSDFPSGSSPRTVEAWIKTSKNVSSGEYRGIFSYGTSYSTYGYYYGFAVDDHVLYFDSWGGGGYSLRGAIAVDNGSWHHVAFTYNGSVGKFYVDGELDTSGAVTINTQLSEGKIGHYDYADKFFNGTIDELVVWNRTLTAEEIAEHYNKTLAGSLKLQVKSCDDENCDEEVFVGPNNETSEYFTDGDYNDISFLADNQYFQYKAFFETSDADYTPKLYNVTVQGSTVVPPPQEVEISNAWINWNGTNISMAGSGYYYSWSKPGLDWGMYTYKVYANDTFGNINSTKNRTVIVPAHQITFNVTSGEDGTAIPYLDDIVCNYTGFVWDSDPDNPYGPYNFPPGNWECKFVKDHYYNRTQSFVVEEDKILDITLSYQQDMTIEEHNWLRDIYDCLYTGNCRASDLWENINETTTNVWNEFKQTDESIITETIVTKEVSSTSNLTIDYSIAVPTKEDYKFLPIRVMYWFLNATDNKTCYNQAEEANSAETPYCNPLIAQTVGEVNTEHNFTVELHPALPTGEYTIVRRVEIDPPESGMPKWINYGHEIIGKIKVLESNNIPSVSLTTNTDKQEDHIGKKVLSYVTGNAVKDLGTTVKDNKLIIVLFILILFVMILQTVKLQKLKK